MQLLAGCILMQGITTNLHQQNKKGVHASVSVGAEREWGPIGLDVKPGVALQLSLFVKIPLSSITYIASLLRQIIRPKSPD